MTIGERIRERRTANRDRYVLIDWSQAACAQRAGVSQGNWADVERGRYATITVDMLTRFAKALKCEPGDLL